MKFQKDNSRIALTDEMIKEEEEKAIVEKKRIKKEKEHKVKVEKEIWKLRDEYQKVMDNLSARQYSYAPVDVQLDMLWHDMDRGTIKVDKSYANTWYNHVKSVKENFPIPTDWREQMAEIQNDLNTLLANTNIEVV